MNREEIREGIAQRLHTQERAILRVTCETSPYNRFWDELTEEDRDEYRKIAKTFISYLHSQGVVIKVETWLPTRGGMTCTIEPLVATESLVEG